MLKLFWKLKIKNEFDPFKSPDVECDQRWVGAELIQEDGEVAAKFRIRKWEGFYARFRRLNVACELFHHFDDLPEEKIKWKSNFAKLPQKPFDSTISKDFILKVEINF